jgi:RecG-like helicase
MLTLFPSQITDLPPGRIPVQTYTIEGSDKGFEDVYKVTILSKSSSIIYL